MVTKRFTLNTPIGILIFDVAFGSELDAEYFRWVLSPDVFQYDHSFMLSPRPSNTYVVLNRNATELSISKSCISNREVLKYFRKQSFHVTMVDAQGTCPGSTYDLSAKLQHRLGRIFTAHILGLLFAVRQTDLFKDLFDACFNEICTSINDRKKRYQAVAEILLTSISPPFPFRPIRPQVKDTPTIDRYLKVFLDCFRTKLPSIGSNVVFNSEDQSNLLYTLVLDWDFYLNYSIPVSLKAEVDQLDGKISNYPYLLWSFIDRNFDRLKDLIQVYPLIVDHLLPQGVVDTFVLWNEIIEDPYHWSSLPVLEKHLPEKPFSKRLSPIGYHNIYRLAKREMTMPRSWHQGSSCMTTLVPFVRLYDLLSPCDGRLLSLRATDLLHKALNSEIVLEAMRSGLHKAMNQNAIQKMLFKPAKSLETIV